MNRIIALILAGLLLIGSPVSFAWAEEVKEVRVDFANHTGVPLLKRQNTFSVSYSFGLGGDSAPYLKAASTLQGLRSENMRVDLSMGNGGLGKYFAQGTVENMVHEFAALDVLLKQLYINGTQPYFSYTYTPKLLQPEGGKWKNAPSDFDAWKQLCSDIAAHYEELGWPLAAHEIWNEPDLGTTFYDGTWEDFIKMYDYGARGIREANPDATVGGMSLAFAGTFDKAKIRQFLSHVQENNLPMDFLSYHNYSTSRYMRETELLNGILSEYGDRFNELALHINEFHVRDIWTTETSSNADSASLAMQAIARLVDMPTVTSVNWATWRDNGEGLNMVDNQTGQRSAMYHALRIYNDMPIDRVRFEGAKYVDGLASVDEQSAGVILYTRSLNARQVKVSLENLPFDLVDVKVYAIDANHSSIYDGSESDTLEAIDVMTGVSSEGLAWTGTLAARGILYIRILPAGQNEEQNAVWSMDGDIPVAGEIATVVRKEYYFEDRSTTMFSEFDLGTFTAWAGMGDAKTGLSKGSVVLENLPATLTVSPTLYGDLAEGASCFLYAQYCSEHGENVATSAWTLGENVWKPADFDAQAESLSLYQTVTLETPADFAGTLRLTWGIQNAGQDTTLKLAVDK